MENENQKPIGVFPAKIKDYGTSEAKNGNPQVYIRFMFEFNGAQKELTWYGSFAGKAKDITLKTLIYCGLKPQDYGRLVDFKNGVDSNLLDMNKILNIDVQEDEDLQGKPKTVIQWVNDPNLGPQIKKIDDAKNAQYFGSMGFDGDLIRLAGDLGIPLNNGGQNQMGNNQMNNGGQGYNQGNMNQGQNQNYNQGNNGNMNQGYNNQNNMNQGQQQQQQQQQQQNGNMNQQQNNNQGNGNNFQAPF